MENDITAHLDQQRWLINNGLISESLKNQLFFCGSIVHKDVQAIEMALIPEEKRIDYVIFLPEKTINLISRYEKLSKATDLIGLWRFKRLIKKNGSLNLHAVLSKFVKDFCGPKWETTVMVKDFKTYVVEEESGDSGEGWVLNTTPDS
jgi:hypothetical protein